MKRLLYKDGFVFWAVFVYAVLVSFILQKILLPYFLTKWHWGHGLLIYGDWTSMHESAAALAEKIRRFGWTHWTPWPAPRGWVESGFAGAVYALTVSEPWTLIPLNALIHASGAWILLQIVKRFVATKERIHLVVAILPFIFFLTTLSWVSQIHKDGVSIVGSYLYLWGWLVALDFAKSLLTRDLFRSSVLMALGVIFTFFSRPYLCQVLLYLSYFFGTIVTGVFFRTHWLKGLAFFEQLIPLLRKVARFAVLLALIVLMIPFHRYAVKRFGEHASSLESSMYLSSGVIRRGEKFKRLDAKDQSKAGELSPSKSEQKDLVSRIEPELMWNWTWWVPRTLDNKIFSAILARRGYLYYQEAKTNIDSDVEICSAVDFLKYAPRALQIGLFSPFPSLWVGEGSAVSNTVFRKIAGLETLLFYLLFPFLLFAIAKGILRLDLIMLVVFVAVFLVVYSTVVPNVGTLHRLRFGYFAIFYALGISGLFSFIEDRKSIRDRRTKKVGSPVKVLFLCDSLGVGGAERSLLNLVPSLISRGYEIHVAYLQDPDVLLNEFREAGAFVHRLVLTHRWMLPEGIFRVARLLIKEQFDIVLSIVFFAPIYSSLTKWISPRAFRIVSFQGLEFERDQFTTPWMRLRKRIRVDSLRWGADLFVGASEAIRKHYSSEFESNKLIVIPNSISKVALNDFSKVSREQIRRKFGASDDEFVVISPARFIPEKGHIDLLNAIQLLREKNIKVRGWFFGFGELEEQLRARAKELGLETQVLFHKPLRQTELFEAIASSDCFCLASTSEGFGLAIAEAAAVGVPIVATNIGGITQVVEHERSALLVSPRCPSSIANALETIFSSKELSLRLRTTAQLEARKNFNADMISERFHQLFQRILKRQNVQKSGILASCQVQNSSR